MRLLGFILGGLALVQGSASQAALAGVNIAGCDFGCLENGQCFGGGCPSSQLATTQLNHFAYTDKLTLFRIPTGWQFLVNYTLGGPLDKTYMRTKYDPIMQACLNTGSYCIIDIHNYGHYLNQSLAGGIIGQCTGDAACPTNAHFVSVWSQLAKRYKAYDKVIFGIMNEPHDLGIKLWAKTCQLVVNAIRKAGARNQKILIPGSEFSHAGNFPYYSGPALLGIKDTDGGNELLVFDIHQYFDTNGYGVEKECVTNHIDDAWTNLAQFLRDNGRQAIVSETGGGNTASCVKYVCEALDYLNANSDVFLGWVGWAAGSFSRTYNLSEVPGPNGKDTLLVQKCIAGKYVA